MQIDIAYDDRYAEGRGEEANLSLCTLCFSLCTLNVQTTKSKQEHKHIFFSCQVKEDVHFLDCGFSPVKLPIALV